MTTSKRIRLVFDGLDDVDTWVAVGLAQAMCPPQLQLCVDVALAECPADAVDLLQEVGLPRPTSPDLAESDNVIRLTTAPSSEANVVSLADAEGGFSTTTLPSTQRRRVHRGRLREGLQHAFRRTEGVFVDDETVNATRL